MDIEIFVIKGENVFPMLQVTSSSIWVTAERYFTVILQGSIKDNQQLID